MTSSSFKFTVLSIISIFWGINVFVAQAAVDLGTSRLSLTEIIKVDRVFNARTRISIDRRNNTIGLSGIANEQTRGNRYLDASLTFQKTYNLTGFRMRFLVKGSEGALFVRFYNENEDKPCWAFRGYGVVNPHSWTLIELQENVSSKLTWHGDIVNGEKADNINRIELIFRPDEIDNPGLCEFKEFHIDEIFVPRFSRIISEELTVNDIKPVSEKTTLIRDGKPVAKVIIPADRDLDDMETKALEIINSDCF